MADPTLEEDLAFVRRKMCTCPSCSSALDRIAAALKDHEHLETGARMLSSQLEWSIAAGLTPKEEVTAWLERERARKQGIGT